MTHTATPWAIEHTDAGAVKVVDTNGFGICHFTHAPTGSEANAEFIVRACNAHDALLEYFRASQSFQAILCRVDANIEQERKAGARYEAAEKAAAEAIANGGLK